MKDNEFGMHPFPDPEVYEIAPNVTSEKMIAQYLDQAQFIEQPRIVYRLNVKGARYYYTIDENFQVRFYNSTTEFIKKSKGEDRFLVEWRLRVGEKKAQEIMTERSFYGTFMHIEAQSLLVSRVIDLDGMKFRLKEYIDANHLHPDFMYNLEDLKDDLMAFAQFMIDRNVQPIAIEIVLANDETGNAGAIDCPAWMDWEGKRVLCIIDLKSRRDGFFEDHVLQLGDYRDTWNYNFPDFKIHYIFNWSPKNWRGKKPTYNLVNQTNNKCLDKLPHLRALVNIDEEISSISDRKVSYATGYIDLDNVSDLSANIVEVSLADKVREMMRDSIASEEYDLEEIEDLKKKDLIEFIESREIPVDTKQTKEKIFLEFRNWYLYEKDSKQNNPTEKDTEQK